MDDHFYIIGIDFGTTYSGIAWCWSGQPDNIQLVTKWKTRLNLNHDNGKVPTEICYQQNSGDKYWGYDVPPDEEPIRWFKLLLVDQTDLTAELRNSAQITRARQLVHKHGKKAVDVVADYLQLLWTHAIEDITRDRGEAAVKGSAFKVWITVPAIWKEDACDQMRQAAGNAGILKPRTAGATTLDLVAEPEAAALAVLDDYKGRPDVQVGDIFVICDAGGGTVDIISYIVMSTDPMTVQEYVEGKGKMCGAIFIDEAFEKMLRSTLGDKWKRLSATSKKTMMNNEWEHGIKRLFDDSTREWNVAVPTEAFPNNRFKLHPNDKKGKPDHGIPDIKSSQMKLQRGHIRTFFGTVLPGIRGLIHEQIKAVKEKHGKPPKAVLLVGGLGACSYLYQQLKIEFEPKDIMVLQPSGTRPWTAIFRGAVIRGLSDAEIKSKKSSMVISRVSRVNYGITFQTTFHETEHDAADKLWDSRELRYMATNQMEWYLKRGDDVFHNKPIKFSWYKIVSNASEMREFSVGIYRNNDEIGPSRMTADVKSLIKMTVRVNMPFEDLREWKNKNGEKFRKLSYDIEMTSTGVSMQWKCYVNGKVQGEQNVKIER